MENQSPVLDEVVSNARRRFLHSLGAATAAGVGIAIASRDTVQAQGTVTVPSYTRSGLPTAGTAGRLARVSDNVRGLWMDMGNQWFGVSGEVANVREFGAKGLGNSSDDDRGAIQTAIDAVYNAGGGVVFFPPGTYYVGKDPSFDVSIVLQPNVVLVGASPWESVIKAKAGTNAIAMIDTGDSAASGVGVMNLGVDGDGTNQDSLYIIGIRFGPVSRGFIRNCYIVNTARSGIVVGRSAWTAGTAFDIDVSGNVVKDCGKNDETADPDKNGISIVNARRVTVCSNLVTGSVLTGIGCEKHDAGSQADTLDEIVIANNVVEGSLCFAAPFGISVLGEQNNYSTQITVANNLVLGDGEHARVPYFFEWCNVLNISNNIAMFAMESGIDLGGVYRATVQGNGIYGAGLYGSSGSYSGIKCRSALTGQGSGLGRCAILCITGNIVESLNEVTKPKYGIDLSTGDDATAQSLILGNNIRDYATAATNGGTGNTLAYNPTAP